MGGQLWAQRWIECRSGMPGVKGDGDDNGSKDVDIAAMGDGVRVAGDDGVGRTGYTKGMVSTVDMGTIR